MKNNLSKLIKQIKFPKYEYYLSHKEVFTTINEYPNCAMKPFINCEEGIRMLCHIKKGQIEIPHIHTGRYEWFVIEGSFKMKNPLSGKEDLIKAGDYYCNPSNIPHEHECLEDAIILWIYNKEFDYKILK